MTYYLVQKREDQARDCPAKDSSGLVQRAKLASTVFVIVAVLAKRAAGFIQDHAIGLLCHRLDAEVVFGQVISVLATPTDIIGRANGAVSSTAFNSRIAVTVADLNGAGAGGASVDQVVQFAAGLHDSIAFSDLVNEVSRGAHLAKSIEFVTPTVFNK